MRMYFFVPYNISDIQKGIQAGHAALEYARLFGDTPEFKYFVQDEKTWVILNGGTTKDVDVYGIRGMMNDLEWDLYENKIPYSYFKEPDLNNALTALCFLAPEQVYDYEKYPDYMPEFYINYIIWAEDVMGGAQNVFLRNLIRGKESCIMLTIQISNDSSGTEDFGNYEYEVLINDRVIERGIIKNFERNKGWRRLVAKTIEPSFFKKINDLMNNDEV